jgi:exosome complex RNA-binding protein Rrp42 (RNase PH superfamily)
MFQPVSDAEIAFVSSGCQAKLRYDGRGPSDCRSISLENNIFPHLNGSSRVKISDSIDVICSLKLEIAEPNMATPDEGLLEIHVDISPSCRISLDDRSLQAIGLQISSSLQSTYLGSSSVDLKTLSIIVGKFCWSIQVDLLILQIDGDPSDACSIATYVALRSCKMPKVELIAGESGTQEDFEVSGDLSDGLSFNCGDVPLSITILKVGSVFLVDSSGLEQACASCALSISIDQRGNCCGLSYLKSGAMTIEELEEAISIATRTADAIFSQLDSFSLHTSSSSSIKDDLYPDMPAVRQGLLA